MIRFYKVRRQAHDPAMPQLSGRSAGYASGRLRRLFDFLSGDRNDPGDNYKGDIASVSRAQDATFNSTACKPGDHLGETAENR